MGSGPRAGIGELFLPELQKGSSIMPGQGQPGDPRGRAAGLRAGDRQRPRDHDRRHAGQFELNVRVPLIARNLLSSLTCSRAPRPCSRRSASTASRPTARAASASAAATLAVATALNGAIGYDRGDRDRQGGDRAPAARCARSRSSRASSAKLYDATIDLRKIALGNQAVSAGGASAASISLEQQLRAGLRERFVEVAALRRLHARRAAVRAAALADQPQRVADELLEAREGERG